jgi:hypothetical protein
LQLYSILSLNPIPTAEDKADNLSNIPTLSSCKSNTPKVSNDDIAKFKKIFLGGVFISAVTALPLSKNKFLRDYFSTHKLSLVFVIAIINSFCFLKMPYLPTLCL